MDYFAKIVNSYKTVGYFLKKLHLRCLSSPDYTYDPASTLSKIDSFSDEKFAFVINSCEQSRFV